MLLQKSISFFIPDVRTILIAMKKRMSLFKDIRLYFELVR